MGSRVISPFNVFLMSCLITFWGSSFVVVKLALGEGLSPIAIATFRFLVAGGLFLAVLFFNRTRNKNYVVLVKGRDLATLILLALTGVTFFFVVQYTGIQLAGASVAAILVCFLSPILISALSARIYKESLKGRQVLGIGVAATGTIAVIVGGTLSLQSGMGFFFGTLILLLTPVFWAIYTLVGKKVMEKYDAFLTVAYVNILGGLFLTPLSLTEGSFGQILALSLNEWMAVLFLACACSLFGYSIWFHVIKRVRASVTSSFLFAEPLVTVLLAKASALGEEVTPAVLAGGCLIFVGVYLVTRK
jgi:drug/metabolite transporter (DMT)-like permease